MVRGKDIADLAEGVRGLLKRYDPSGEMELTGAIDAYISDFGYRLAIRLEEELLEERRQEERGR